jgi:hypothetical protein
MLERETDKKKKWNALLNSRNFSAKFTIMKQPGKVIRGFGLEPDCLAGTPALLLSPFVPHMSHL